MAYAIASLQAAIQLSKALIGLRDAAMIDAKVIELRDNLIEVQGSTMQAQTEQSSLIQEVRDLKQQIMDLENWNKEQQRYQLISPWPGGFVYALKEASKGADPPHWICQHCYENRRKSILQHSQKRENRIFHTLKCFHCNFEVERHGESPKYV